MKIPLSIVITTYNREKELRRCIKSILEQNYEEYEIIVIDDNSKPSYKEQIMTDFPTVKYLYQKVNKGPGVARNIGIQEAEHNYIVIMDDDDIFIRGAFESINKFLVNKEGKEFPVFNFLRTNAINKKNENYSIFTLKDMVDGKIQGDLTPVINKRIFYQKEQYMYPKSRIGAELLLWYRIAIDYGYPIINETIVQLMDDSNERLTNIDGQVKKAKLFAEYQQNLINEFEDDILQTGNLNYLLTKYKGAITYSLLSGNRRVAREYLMKSLNFSKKQLVFLPLIILPKWMLIKLFIKYRQ